MNSTLDKVNRYVIAFGVLTSVGALSIGGVDAGVGAFVGALVAMGNWFFLRWVTTKVASGSVRSKAPLMILLVAKMGFLGVVCWALITRWEIHPIGFVLGLSSMVVAIFVGFSFNAPHTVAPEES